MILKVFTVTTENQLKSHVGYVIGHHYETSNSNVIMTMAFQHELCCGLELGDLGVYHNADVYDDSLPINVKRTGLESDRRIAGVVAHVNSCK